MYHCNMNINLRNFFLKMIPYILSIIGGVVLFKLTGNNIHDENLAGLVTNIAASLLAIPLVFILYDYSNYLVSRRLNKTMADHMTDKLNVILLNLIIIIRQILSIRQNLTFISLNKMADISVSKMIKDLKITPTQIKDLRIYYNELDSLVYNSTKTDALTNNQLQLLTSLMRELSLLINEYKFRHNRRAAAKYLANMIGKIIEWLDSDAFAAMHFQQLLDAAKIDAVNQKNAAIKKP